MARASNAAIIALWNKDMSAGMVGVELSITRNTVMGVISRAQRKGDVARRSTQPPRPVRKLSSLPGAMEARSARGRISAIARWAGHVKRAPKAVVQPPPALSRLGLGLPSGDLTLWHCAGGCCHIANDDMSQPQWCNAPIWGKSSWCEFHYGRVFRVGA